MSETKHTPGPWSFDVLKSPDSRGMGYICDAHGKEISHHGVSERWESENLANAHLIAAAPELYEALNDLFKAEYDDAPLTPELGQKCLTALKKASGEQP